jgi:hypothetical protein
MDKVGMEAEIDLDIVGITVEVALFDAGEEDAGEEESVGFWLYAILQISSNFGITDRTIGIRRPRTSAVSNLKNS